MILAFANNVPVCKNMHVCTRNHMHVHQLTHMIWVARQVSRLMSQYINSQWRLLFTHAVQVGAHVHVVW
jgi:hypothetical protein